MLMCLCGDCSWTKSQIRARSHPNVLAATTWLNKMYHSKSGNKVEDVDLDKPLMYAERFRIRHPGVQWDAHPPHVDGTYGARDSRFTCMRQLTSHFVVPDTVAPQAEASSGGRTSSSAAASRTSSPGTGARTTRTISRTVSTREARCTSGRTR